MAVFHAERGKPPHRLMVMLTHSGHPETWRSYRFAFNAERPGMPTWTVVGGNMSAQLAAKADWRLAMLAAKGGLVAVTSEDGDTYRANLPDVFNAWAHELGLM